MNSLLRPALPGLGALLLASCGGGDQRPTLTVEHDTVGDTVIVRTLAGQTWDGPRVLEPEMRIGTLEGEDVYMLGDVRGMAVGPGGEVYIYDRQGPALRKYAPDGTFMATFGREGGGPGEYKSSDGGLAVLEDGRVLLRDPGNARISVFSSSGEYLEGWPLRGGYFAGRPLFTDTAGFAYTQIWGSDEDGNRYSALQPLAPDGTLQDSLPAPTWEHDPATVEFSSERLSMANPVPFTPRSHWTFSPLGYYVGGLSTDYSVDLFRRDGTVLRIQRETEPVAMEAGEKEARREEIASGFRQLAPDWKWNGPAIPDEKPPFRSLSVARDGRIWVRLHQPAERMADAGTADPDAPEVWKELVVWDVFEPDGTYLGQVRGPSSIETHPEPVIGSDHVWAITTDELDVEYLTRFLITRPDGDADGRTAAGGSSTSGPPDV